MSPGAAGQPPNCDCEMVLSGHKDVVMTVAMLEARLVVSCMLLPSRAPSHAAAVYFTCL